MMSRHTSKEFEQELSQLRERLLAMGGRAEGAIAAAVTALYERNDALAEKVIAEDDLIDKDEIEIDQLAETILATRQPVASDLRFLTMSLKIVTDLERIGDLAANIAKRVLELGRMPSTNMEVDFSSLAQRVRTNVRDALDSFVAKDAEKAARVIAADVEIDAENARVFSFLISRVAVDPKSLARIIPLTSIARSFERIGDHAKNLAEEVVYMVRGSDVRHGRRQRP
jgi:phosphate transport system protein